MVDSQLQESLGPLAAGTVLSDRVFETVSDAIVSGRIPGGQQVSDKSIAEALGISRTPVREALQRLAWLGLVEVSPNRYTRVTEVTDEMVSSTLEYTGMQAGMALQLAMRRMDDAALQEAVAMLDRMIAASDADDADDLMLAARMFVGFLTRESGNRLFATVMHESSLLVARNLRQSSTLIGTATFRGECYRQMRAAMLIRDADAAELWFRRQHGVGAGALSV
ncbi:GntR family transcriptional regulator [Microbacterium saperdae]|uniref:GntR family transcriptional regulator n=1 Tax=Microbacterium saperdae TaxID=69368 RepID=A0A543BB41_9MICO|nr:GntR family transcriptional regulator [Microbacterium saperdae]TQL81963.1 GntR family transcriptional regulator [Microbacterium saperdae]GGM36137.1 GntR family transcriptional regulator [Microbacterium saperdae]